MKKKKKYKPYQHKQYKHKSKNKYDSLDVKIMIGLVMFVILSFAFLFFKISYVGAQVMHTQWYIYGSKILISIILIFLSFYEFLKVKVPNYISVLLLTYLAILWLLTIYSNTIYYNPRIAYLSSFIWAVTSIITSIYQFYKMEIKDEREFNRLDLVTLLVLLGAFISVMNINCINDNAFIISSIIIGFIGAIICIFIIYIKKIAFKLVLFTFPLFALIFTCLFSYFTLSLVNYTLDFSKPTIIFSEIIGKDIQSGSRQVTSFDFTVKIGDDNVNVSVDSYVYYYYDVGDYIRISYYKGFLNEAYYTYEK